MDLSGEFMIFYGGPKSIWTRLGDGFWPGKGMEKRMEIWVNIWGENYEGVLSGNSSKTLGETTG